ncbi:MAG: xanthine dehydrogenase family protein molybdopterin-binding subunit [Acidimicrobiia bacterium]
MEDQRILTGRGRYIDDLKLPRMVHAAFLRSSHAHARITAIDTSAALEGSGVVAVFSGADVADLMGPFPIAMAGLGAPVCHALATDRVRYVGDPLAVVVAASRHEAEDALELIDVSYEQLAAITGSAVALDPSSPRVFDDIEGNVMTSDEASFGDVDTVFETADRVFDFHFSQHRVSPMPMETRGTVADFDAGSGELTMHCNVQTPHALRLALSMALEMSMDGIRVLTSQDIGGAFGLKSSFGRENFCLAAIARRLARPVKWTEDRYEHLLSSGHAREETVDVEVAVTDDGTLLGLRAHVTVDQGAYPTLPFPTSVVIGLAQTLLPGPYRWQAYAFSRTLAITNKCTYVAYRGPWEIETWVRERMLDEVARELQIDPADLRRRNVVSGGPDDRLVSGPTLAGASCSQQLERVLERIGYEDFRREQAEARAAGRCLGIGMAAFIEPAPGPPDTLIVAGPFKSESANVKLEGDGHLLVVTAQVPHGQSHQTTLAQVAADEMGIPFEHVRVVHGDTRTAPFKFTGTGGSMASTWASGAVLLSTRKVKEKVLEIAGRQLEIDPADLEIIDGMVMPRGTPAVSLPLAQIAMQATMMPHTLPPGTDPRLQAEERFSGEEITGSGWSGGTHACIVEVDLATGLVDIRRYVVVEDCGRLINPAVVDGQIRGGVMQGIGQVLYEHAAYDDEGNFLTSTFMDYLLPTSAEAPVIEIEHLETDPDGEFGFRGVGEGGAIVSPATVTNAVADALAPLGARLFDQYLPPARVLELAGVVTSG